jgi:hypothetical protein
MSVWQLLLKQNKTEAIDTKEFNSYDDAYLYFRQQKKLESLEFDKLFIVKHKFFLPRTYKWWIEERHNLDIEKS